MLVILLGVFHIVSVCWCACVMCVRGCVRMCGVIVVVFVCVVVSGVLYCRVLSLYCIVVWCVVLWCVGVGVVLLRVFGCVACRFVLFCLVSVCGVVCFV